MNRVAQPVPAASSSGVSPLGRTRGETPRELAGEDACATTAVPVQGFKARTVSGKPLPVGQSSSLDLPDHYDLVAISSFTAQIFEAYEVADFYRSKNIPVVMGGLHVTMLPEEAMEHCTSVVAGEGEPLWPEVLRDFED